MNLDLLATKLVDLSMKTYATHGERSAMRCALSDAAALLDDMATQIGNDNRSRGRILKAAKEQATLLTKAANEIWAMRGKIVHPNK